MSSALETDARRFEEDVLRAATPVLVDFWAPWCGPCRSLAPHIDRIAQKYDGRIVVVKLNVDNAPELKAHYALKGIPALFLFDGGEVVDKVFGAAPRQVEQMLDTHLARMTPPPPGMGEQPWTPPPPPRPGSTPPQPPDINRMIRRRNG